MDWNEQLLKFRMRRDEEPRIRSIIQKERSFLATNEQWIAGVDEAGRGPLAGPVVSAAVIFPKEIYIPFINDSKKLNKEKRNILFHIIQQKAITCGVGIISPKEIDKINILQATFKTMQMALQNLSNEPDLVLVDGRQKIPNITIRQVPVIKGDSQCFSIAAASILAKVTRDNLMLEYDKKYPQYGFANHKGYGTKTHIEAIRKYGPCEIHRQSFRVKSNHESQ